MDLDALLALEEAVVFRVEAPDDGVRLDVALHRRVGRWASRSAVAGWIRAGRASLDGVPVRRPAARLRSGARVELRAPKNPQDLLAEPLEPDVIPVVARGPGWIAVDKPTGLPVHPARGEVRRTLVVALAERLRGDYEPGGPWLCHRLDRHTSGLLLVALTAAARDALVAAFAAGRVRRFYAARVAGAVPWPARRQPAGWPPWDDAAAAADLTWPLRLQTAPPFRVECDPAGTSAHTRVQVLRAGPSSDLLVEPITGRQHQIRVHLARAGHPIVGDPFYGPPDAGPRMALHALALQLPPELAPPTPLRAPVPFD